jgi:hypothetical protein
MRQLSGRMSGTEIELEMEIQSVRVRLAQLEETVRTLQGRLSTLEQAVGEDAEPAAGF